EQSTITRITLLVRLISHQVTCGRGIRSGSTVTATARGRLSRRSGGEAATMRVEGIVPCGLAIMLLGTAILTSQAKAACLSKPEMGPNGEPRRVHIIAPERELASYRLLGYTET